VRPHPGLLAMFIGSALGGGAAAAPLTVYDDALATGFANWSWATVESQTAVRHAGTHALRVDAAAWQAWFAHRDAGIDTNTYGELSLWMTGSSTVSVALISGGAPVGNAVAVALSGTWSERRLAFTAFGVSAGTPVDGVWVQEATGAAHTYWIDDVVFLERTTPPQPAPNVTVTVDPALDRRAISPLIYGVNFGTDEQAAAMRWPLRRWGGNATTRYNWQADVRSVGSDWFYFNYTNLDPAPPSLPHGSSADRFIDATRATGGEPLMTLPLIGWTPLDRTRRWSFPVSVYGAQQQTECTATGGVFWCNPDAGNGISAAGAPLTADPLRTSRAVGAQFAADWVRHIAGRLGTAAQGGVRFYALDNEPALWNSTHRDVHPNPTTYDELWQKTLAVAAAVKAADPGAQLLGPVSWGWCEYFFSAADGCAVGPDRQAHGGLPWIDWYLGKARDHEIQHGVRLVDYLDLHYYPQNGGVALSDDESAGTAAARLRSLKSLYDPNYVDETWINTRIRLIPRMREWVASHAPGTKLAITEYSWGNDDGLTSALAQAEALAIFGREGVDLATRWIAPAAGSRVEDAFKLYLNWNGSGARVAGDSVRATSTDVDAVGAYAIEQASGRRYVLLFNKDTRPRHVSVHLASGAFTAPASLTRFDAMTRLSFAGTATPVAGALELDLPARSATLAVIEGPSPSGPSQFYPLTPCRLLDTRDAAGPFGGPRLAGSTTRAFAFAGRCGVPADAVALSVNATGVNATAPGTLRAFAADGVVPASIVLSYAAGTARGNNAVIAVSRDGQTAVAVRPDSAVDLILDVNGYFR
jgi:hypothetical protein